MATKITVRTKKKIIERLAKGDDPANITLDLCESLDINWSQAEALVNNIHSDNKNEITLTQSPLLVSIALAVFIGGIALIGGTAYDLSVTYNIYNQTYNETNSPHIGYLFVLFFSGGWFWEGALLGLVMIIGSLRGMQDVWVAIFVKLGIFQGND